MPTTSDAYGTLPDGTPIEQITLTHPAGMVLKGIQYGGIITELWVPDAAGQTADVVLGLPSLDDYLAGHPWFGAITGRVAGRITEGKFTLDGKNYVLEQNNETNLLHGGSNALDKQVWDAQVGESEKGEPWVTFSHCSPDGANGFPGELKLKVTYLLSNDKELVISYEATTTQRTPLSLTNHSYFNLAGEGQGTVEDHLIQIHADQYVPAELDGTLTGRVQDVAGTANDLRQLKRTGDVIPGLRDQHGENYLIRREGVAPKELVPVARIEEPGSGRVMEVFSTEQSLQFYSGRFLDNEVWVGKSGKTYQQFDGFCFECQGYPDGVHSPEIEDILLNPGETYRQTTIYRFSVAGS